MTIDDIAGLINERADELRGWQQLGLIGLGDELSADDLERARLVAFAARQGVSPDELARISAEQGDMVETFVRWARRPGRDAVFTREEIVERTGMDPDLLDSVLGAAGLHDLNYGYEEDLESLQLLTTALKMGLPEEALLQILRVLSDSLYKASETMTRVFHLYVHERLRASGLRGAELMATTQNLADPMAELVEPAVMYFHRRAWERANREDMVLHLVEETTPPSEVPGELCRTILFVDLSSFTPLTEAMGDVVAARVVERFSTMVRETAARCDGQVLKQIGDEFMLVFPAPRRAVSFGLAILDAAGAEPQFPALRIGAHSGSVLYREGDYLGANVNLAARVTSAAKRNQLVITNAVRQELHEPDVQFESLGPHTLKGVSEPVELFEVRGATARRVRIADPVCGMELDEATSDAELSWEGRRLLFCSEGCLRRFLENPERYAEK
jgi:adenylate cyclase